MNPDVGPQTVSLSPDDAPGIEQLKPGTEVSGQFTGTITSFDESGNAVISVKLEPELENSADKALRDMSSQPDQSSMNDNEDEEDDF